MGQGNRLENGQLNNIIRRVIREVKYNIVPNGFKIGNGEYQCVDGGGFYKVEGFGGETFVGLRMYYSDAETYCLLRNIDNWKYVFARLKSNDNDVNCKFIPIKFAELPKVIQKNFNELKPLLRKTRQAYA